MDNGSRETTPFPTSYEQIGRRIQRLVAAPSVQKIQHVTVSKREDEPLEAWNSVLQELEETDGVQLEQLPDGAVRIGWQKYIDA
ncbi:MAG TPA: DUF1654 domain-containing protein [Pseudomonas sp.]|uniref:DUF1654 domain-containing protein n=1 Tax=Pseudomonas sp. TaxID=306 RepID=UPI002ED90616